MSLSSRFKMDSTDDISNESPLTSPKESDYKNFNDTFQSAIDDSAQKFVNYDTSLFTNSFEVNESQLMHQNEAGEKEVDDIEVNFSRYSALQPPLTPPPPPLPKSGFNMRSPSAPASNSTCRSNQSKPGRALIAELEQHHFRSSRVSRVPSKSSDRSCSALPRLSNNKESEKFDFNEANSSNLTKMDRLKLTDSMPKFDGHVKKLASEFGLKAGKKTVISMTGRNFRSKETASEDVPDTRIRSPEFQLQTSSSTSKTGQSSPVFTYKNSSEFTNPINSSPSADARLFYDANSGSKHNSPGNVLHDDYFDSSPESMTSSPPMSPVAQKSSSQSSSNQDAYFLKLLRQEKMRSEGLEARLKESQLAYDQLLLRYDRLKVKKSEIEKYTKSLDRSKIKVNELETKIKGLQVANKDLTAEKDKYRSHYLTFHRINEENRRRFAEIEESLNSKIDDSISKYEKAKEKGKRARRKYTSKKQHNEERFKNLLDAFEMLKEENKLLSEEIESLRLRNQQYLELREEKNITRNNLLRLEEEKQKLERQLVNSLQKNEDELDSGKKYEKLVHFASEMEKKVDALSIDNLALKMYTEDLKAQLTCNEAGSKCEDSPSQNVPQIGFNEKLVSASLEQDAKNSFHAKSMLKKFAESYSPPTPTSAEPPDSLLRKSTPPRATTLERQNANPGRSEERCCNKSDKHNVPQADEVNEFKFPDVIDGPVVAPYEEEENSSQTVQEQSNKNDLGWKSRFNFADNLEVIGTSV